MIRLISRFVVIAGCIFFVSACTQSKTSDDENAVEQVAEMEGQIRSAPEYFEPLDPNYVKNKRRQVCSAAREAAVSNILESLRQADERDRKAQKFTFEQDRVRRAEVAKLFAEGCMSTSRDYYNAALIFQHGEVPDHLYQSYLWAQKAVDMGDDSASWLIPRSIDRYMVSSGYKQVFGTRIVPVSSYRPNATQQEQKEFCLWPMAAGAGERFRAKYELDNVNTRIERVLELNQQNGINTAGMCKVEVPNPPRGMFRGDW